MKRQLAVYVWNLEVECFKKRDVLDIKLFHNRMQGVFGYLKTTEIHKSLARFVFQTLLHRSQIFRPILTQDYENIKCDKTEKNKLRIEVRIVGFYYLTISSGKN
jgi:hypothetical protein